MADEEKNNQNIGCGVVEGDSDSKSDSKSSHTLLFLLRCQDTGQRKRESSQEWYVLQHYLSSFCWTVSSCNNPFSIHILGAPGDVCWLLPLLAPSQK
jgi:hypothetical protein